MVIPDCAGYLTMNPVDIYHQIAIHFIRSYGKRVTRTLYAHVDMCPGGIPNMLRYPHPREVRRRGDVIEYIIQ